MDANGQRFWMVRGGKPWTAPVGNFLDQDTNFLRLGSKSDAASYPEDKALADAALKAVPQARDTFGGRAFFDETTKTIQGTGVLPNSVAILNVPAGATDLALGFEGYLYVATGGSVLVHDIRKRWEDATATRADFSAWRVAPDPAMGAWVLDGPGKKLARVRGRLWPAPSPTPAPPDAFVPVSENGDPIRLVPHTAPWLDVGEDPVGIACSPDGRVALLIWTAGPPRIRFVDLTGRLGAALSLTGIKSPYSLAWISEDRLAVLVAGVIEALVYSLPDTEYPPVSEAFPVGDIYPLRDHDGSPLLHGTSWPVEYLAKQPTSDDPARLIQRPLVAASLPAFASSALGVLTTPLDAGTAGTAWHRLYVEAEIPGDTSFTLFLAASDTKDDPAAITDHADWHPHHFGSGPVTRPSEPRAAWLLKPSELPGQNGFLEAPPEKDRNGLFTVLIQRSNRPVRTLCGRFLHLKIELRGTLRSTPCIHAIRAYGPRFSYQDKYLPAFYRESLFGIDADEVAPNKPATRADFLGRFLANFESVLTPLEDEIASSWLLTDPRTTPDSAIPWLGSWIGVAYETWYPAARRRTHLRNAAELFRRRGTLSGFKLALDIATGGGVGQGKVIVIEDFWFRRSLQTILGLDLDQVDDPLLGGPLITGNSKLGRTLILSEKGMAEKFLALFDASIHLNAADQETVDDFFSSMAFRATVIVHDETEPDELRLINRVAAIEAPAHIAVRVRKASQDFLIGLAALVGADTYLAPPSPDVPVQVNKTQLGDGSLLLRPPSLDPRLEGAPS